MGNKRFDHNEGGRALEGFEDDPLGTLWDASVNPAGELQNTLYGDAAQIDYDAQGRVRQPGMVENPGLGGMQGGQDAYGNALAAGPRGFDTSVTDKALRSGNAVRGKQWDIANQLQAAANGDVESAAQIQMGLGLEQGLRDQLALANSAGGGTGATVSALRNAQNTGAQMSAQTNANMAALRAQEQAGARAALAGHMSGMRAQDQGLANIGLQASGLELQGRGLDDQNVVGLGGLARGFAGDEVQRQLAVNQQGIDRDLGVAQIDADIAKANAAADAQARQGVFGAVGAGMGAMFGGG